VRVSARAVYSKYSIEPASPIDFGSMIKGTRKTQMVMLENKGLLPFKFCAEHTPCWGAQGTAVRCCSLRHQPLLALFLQGQNSFGMFTVFPSSGSIAPWGQQKINVECLAGEEGTCEERLYINITGK
ncbi:HYDIN protein, partial [Grantiella picta]|nr:HYDIN protein [Grantiella picta]